MRSIIFSTLCVLVALAAAADATVVTIVDHITTGTDNVIDLPESLRARLVKEIEAPDAEEEQRDETQPARPTGNRPVGYRVQVFSDNNPRTAKAEAGSKQRVIASRFPQFQTYVRYTSPYWRLRVGDFRTQQEANAAADELRKAFPAYSKEIRVVRDRINISGN